MRRWFALCSLIILIAIAAWGAAHGPLTLAWDPVTLDENSNATTIAYYNVRWGTSSGQENSGTSAGNVTQFTVKGLDPAQTYWFVVTAVDTSGRESAVSNEVSGRPSIVIHR